MENGNMDAATWTQLVLGALLAGGGLTGLVNAVAAWRNKKRGAPEVETEARVAADEKSFAAYLRSELRRVQRAGDARVDNVQERLDAAEEYIDDLTEHIYMQKPPPPPARRHPKEGSKDHG